MASIRNRTRVQVLTVAAASTLAGLFSSQAHAVDTFKLSIGVRETNTVQPIGGNGGTAGDPAGGGGSVIDWVNQDGQTIIADGTFQTFTWNFGTDPITTFAGTEPTGGLPNHIDPTKGALEHLRVLNNTGVSNPVVFYIDDIINTPNGGAPVTIENFDSYAAVAPGTNGTQYVFDQPDFSGSTNPLLLAGDKIGVTSEASSSPSNSYRASWQWKDSNPANWLRLTTNNAPNKPNIALDIGPGSTLTMRIAAKVVVPAVGWQVDASGNYSDVANWAGGVPNSATAAGASAVARFGNVIPITAPRTVTLDVTPNLNSLVIDSAQPFTIQDSIVGGAPSGIEFGAQNNEFDSIISVLNGQHIINAGFQFGNTTPNLTINVNKSTDTLALNGQIFTTDPVGGPKIDNIGKSGAGLCTITPMDINTLSVNAGTLRLKNGTGTSNLNTLSIAGTVTAPTAKLDIGDNGVVINYVDAASDPVANKRSQIAAAYHAGAWDSNGITSNKLTANGNKGVALVEASALGLTVGSVWNGVTVDDTSLLLKVALNGDTNIDNTVNFTDLLALAQNYDPAYNPAGPNGPKTWSQGDVNYDGIINFNDLLALAQNYGQTLTGSFAGDWALAQSLVPEPTTLAFVGAMGTLLLRRRK